MTWPPMDDRGPVVTDEDVRAFENQLGTTLPDDYRAFLLDVNGGRTADSHTSFVFDSRRQAGTTLNSLHSLKDPDERFDLAARNEGIRHRSPAPDDLLYIGPDSGGSMVFLVLRGEHRGEVWFLDQYGEVDYDDEGIPEPPWPEREYMSRVAPNFREFCSLLSPLED